MSPQDQTTTESSPLLEASRPASRLSRGPWSPETLLIPVVFASKLGSAMPSTTLAELLRQTVCRLSHRLHDYSSSVPISPQVCDAPQVLRDFATVSALIGIIGGITSLVGCGILSHILQYHGRKPVFLFILFMEVIWSCLVLGSQFMPPGLADWVFSAGMLFHTFSDNFPFVYIANVYIVDICVPEHRTVMMSKLRGWSVLGVCIPLALGGSITTKTDNPLIVFYIATTIFVAAFIYVVFVLPETFPEEKRNVLLRMQQDIPKAALSETLLSVLNPLKLLVPTRTLGGTRNWRLTLCASHNLMFTTAHGYIWIAWFVLASSKYHLTPADNGIFKSCINFTGTIALTMIVPQLVRFLRPYYRRTTRYPVVDEGLGDTETSRAETSDRLDIHLAFVACIFAAFSALCAAMSRTNLALFICAVMSGLGFMHGTITHSLVSKSVDQLKQELALAAIHMVESVANILSPIIMGSIFAATVVTTPLFLFYVHVVVIMTSTGLLLLIRDEDGYHESNQL